MTDNRSLLKLTAEQRQELGRWAQSRTLPAGDVFRAGLIMALADGIRYREIARSLKTSGPTIARWKARVIRRLQQKPGDGSNPLVLPETGQRVGAQQVHRTADSGSGPTETASAATVYGQQRSGFRGQSGGHHRSVSASAAACGRVLRRRKDRDSGFGSARPRAAIVPRPGGTAWFRILPPWHALVICGFGCEDRQGGRPDGEAAYQRRVHRFSGSVAEQGPVGEGNPHRAGQPVGPQD